MQLCVSPRIHRHQTHGLTPCNYCHTAVHQPAYTQTPNALPKAMHLLPYDCASARKHQTHGLEPCIYCHTIVHHPASPCEYTDTKRMAWSHASTAILLCISQRIHRHPVHGLKPCNHCHTPEQQTSKCIALEPWAWTCSRCIAFASWEKFKFKSI